MNLEYLKGINFLKNISKLFSLPSRELMSAKGSYKANQIEALFKNITFLLEFRCLNSAN